MYTDRWICGTRSTASAIYARVPASILPKIEAIAYTRKRQAKQPCLDTEGATESDRCSSSVRMDDIHVGLGDQSGSTVVSFPDQYDAMFIA